MATILSRSLSSNHNIDGFPVQADLSSSSDSDVSASARITKELVRWFKLLADETRLKILIFLLERGELNVRALCDLLRLSQPAVSHHLALLRVDGLIDCRRDGKHNFYRVLPRAVQRVDGDGLFRTTGPRTADAIRPMCAHLPAGRRCARAGAVVKLAGSTGLCRRVAAGTGCGGDG